MPRAFRRPVGAVLAVLVAVLAAGAASAAPPPPPTNAGTLQAFWPNLTSLIGNKAEYGSFEAQYSTYSRVLTWTLDYKGTTGPATAVRVRMRTASGIRAFNLCRGRCVSQNRRSEHGPYYHLAGRIVYPVRDLVVLVSNGGGDVMLATAQYPRGELRTALAAEPTAVGGSSGRCC